ncbi:MAG TPA: hypothetical protein VF802_00720 [Candidatus Limnocylindrales bacterium]
MVRVEPVRVQVRTSWLDGRPTEIVWGPERFRVTRLVGVRQEAAAYDVTVGPRTIFEVEAAGGATLSLSYRHRSRRWTVDGLEDLAFEGQGRRLAGIGLRAA